MREIITVLVPKLPKVAYAHIDKLEILIDNTERN